MTTRVELLDALDRLVTPFERRPAPDPPEPAPPSSRRLHDATAEITLTPAEAHNGTARPIHLAVTERCARCNGTGFRLGNRRCRSCNGAGRETVEHHLLLHVPPHVKHGTELVVRGESPRTDAGGRPGDLYVRIEVA